MKRIHGSLVFTQEQQLALGSVSILSVERAGICAKVRGKETGMQSGI